MHVLVALLFVAFPGIPVVRLARYARTMVKVIGRRPQTDAARNRIDLEFESARGRRESSNCTLWIAYVVVGGCICSVRFGNDSYSLSITETSKRRWSDKSIVS